MVNELQTAFNEIAELRGLPQDIVIEALQSALVSAYRRYSNASAAQNIEARIDPVTKRARIYVEKEVTDDVISPDTEVTLEQARFYNPEAQYGDTVMVQDENPAKQFGRIAAQTAKQVILQKIREAERDAVFDEFIDREGDLITGTVQSMNSSVVTLRLGERAEGILPRSQQIPRERYRQHEKLRVYVVEVKKTNKMPQIVCSRSHRNMLRRLLEYEVPEIYNGQVEIKSIAREAGYRSKVAVAALQEGIDPVGACVGMRGIRIQNIVKELHDEKIDVIEWNSDAEAFISKALSPARVTGVYLDDDPRTGRTAVVVVPDDQLSLAIGREGQNARLAAKLTGWRIDIKSVIETVEGALLNLDIPPLDTLAQTHKPMVEDVQAIMDKRAANKAVMPEEFNKLNKFASLVEKRLQRQRQEERSERAAEIAAIRATLPPALFEVPVEVLGLDDEINEALGEIGTPGDVLLVTLTNEERLQKALAGLAGDPLLEVQTALDELMEADLDAVVEEVAEEAAVAEAEETVAEMIEEAEASEEDISLADLPEDVRALVEAGIIEFPIDDEDDVDVEDVAPAAEAVSTEETAVAEADVVVETEPSVEAALEPVDADVVEVEEDTLAEEVEEADEMAEEVIPETPDTVEIAEPEDELDFILEEDDYLDSMKEPVKKKDRRKRRRLVLDEETGEVVAKRRRKRGRRKNDWDEGEDF